eukprot:CAMPEP_0114341978 /NCGR_PEP_ID=MMETSP0101-20121206/9436_1 /TAXON_ID=38822 ORGANISM="Pteridomonas danica, Strain PT" /NCGR_SAMPLE_ID=MMETSP0101 /ASSEMBLY_ACC=CAM_ASM_000211 /LENGTH=209 /DNA_ID=CAMNT_0001475819 /DNA_START=61 /DNA_END=690 /DNA_ORIENTATION=+
MPPKDKKTKGAAPAKAKGGKADKKAAPAKAAPAPAAAPATPKMYPGDDVAKPKVKEVCKAAKLRSSIEYGTVLILLSGHFRGKRVIFLKQLESGLLLVTGPYEVNGVPLKRVNQAYVIATQTKVNLPAKLPLDINDAYFAKDEEKAKEGEEKFFANEKTKTVTSDKRKADQATMDAAILPVVKKTEMLEAYLQAKFSLKKGDKPHEMKF